MYAVMWNSYQRICFALLYATFASEFGYAGLWNSFLKLLCLRGYMEFLPTHMFALLWYFLNSEYVFAVICISIGVCAFLCE